MTINNKYTLLINSLNNTYLAITITYYETSSNVSKILEKKNDVKVLLKLVLKFIYNAKLRISSTKSIPTTYINKVAKCSKSEGATF